MWTDKKIVVVGTGGVGGYFGARLAEKGLNVTFIARGESLKALQNKGLRVDSVDGDIIIHPVQVTDQPATVEIADLVLVAVKAPQVQDVAELIAPFVGDKTLILPLQNGIDAPAELRAVYGQQHVLGGLCKVISFKIAPGHIRHEGVSIIELGEMDGPITPRVMAIKEVLTFAGIRAIARDDFPRAQWTKMAFVSPLSAITAVTRSPVGKIRSLVETRQMLKSAMQETVQVAQGLGVILDENIVDTMLQWVDGMPETSTTSMQRDIMAGQPSEIHYQVGAVVRLGKELGIETPVNWYFYYSLLPLEMQAHQKT